MIHKLNSVCVHWQGNLIICPCFIPCIQYSPIQLQIKGFGKNSSYILSEDYMLKHTFKRHIHNFSTCWVNTIQKYIVPWNKPAKLCVLCNNFFSLFMLNAEMEYLLNTHVALYSFILPYICYMCTPQFVHQK